ncbi:MAG: DUF1592 domain-containing protein [Limisphaerales bacterium]
MRRLYIILVVFLGIPLGYGLDYDQDVRPFLQEFCIECHGGKKVKGKVDFTKMKTAADLAAAFETWETAIELLKDGEMPPDAAKQPSAADVEVIFKWYQERFVDSVKAHPGYFKPRRLSAWEYRHTLHSLFGFDMETAVIEAQQTVTEKSLVMKLLPTDPPGKSGFKNDTSGNPLTTVIWDQYSYLAEEAIVRYLEKNPEVKPKDAIRRFLPRAVRRPLPEKELSKVVDRVNSNADLKTELKTVLMSPGFIYRGMLMEGEKDKEIDVGQFELAERLSYFLWNDMPDEELFQLARSGQLRAQIEKQVDRMLKSPKSHRFAENFSTQWLALDSMDQFANREVTVAVALKSQPIEFVNYLITENRPLMELIDSKVTYANPILAKFYRSDRKQIAAYRKAQGIEKEIVPHNRITLENTKGRGGIMTMPGILAMNRGPVQRGTWILERILGDHLPEPPPDVGQVEPNRKGEKLSFRQRFENHRSNPTCAVCHDKIDPLGFALQRYTNDGSFRDADNFAESKKKKKGMDYDSGQLDTSGRLPSGEAFRDFAELKQLLLTKQRGEITRNIVKHTLAYALCRKLEIYDQPTVEAITRRLNENDGTWRDLILEVVGSLPFQKTVIKGTNS